MTINPRKIFVDIAREETWVRETSRNQGKGISKYWKATTYPDGYKNREPYCAAFVCWVCAEAERRGAGVGPVPNSAAVRHIVAWSRKLGKGAIVFSRHSKIYVPEPGDLVWFEFGGSTPNHIGFVAGRRNDQQILTIEGNTGKQGSRDGDGVYEKHRSLNLCAGFIRLAWKATPA